MKKNAVEQKSGLKKWLPVVGSAAILLGFCAGCAVQSTSIPVVEKDLSNPVNVVSPDDYDWKLTFDGDMKNGKAFEAQLCYYPTEEHKSEEEGCSWSSGIMFNVANLNKQCFDSPLRAELVIYQGEYPNGERPYMDPEYSAFIRNFGLYFQKAEVIRIDDIRNVGMPASIRLYSPDGAELTKDQDFSKVFAHQIYVPQDKSDYKCEFDVNPVTGGKFIDELDVNVNSN